MRHVLLLSLFFAFLILLAGTPVVAQDTQFSVMAEKGEGIFSLLRRHGLDPSTYMKQFIELNKSNLGKNNALLEGKTYIIPATPATPVATPVSNTSKPATLIRPLLGKKYENVTIRDNILDGAQLL